MGELIELVARNDNGSPSHVCGTCRFYKYDRDIPSLSFCKAVSTYACNAYTHQCHGDYWQAIPPPVPVITKFKRWLIG